SDLESKYIFRPIGKEMKKGGKYIYRPNLSPCTVGLHSDCLIGRFKCTRDYSLRSGLMLSNLVYILFSLAGLHYHWLIERTIDVLVWKMMLDNLRSDHNNNKPKRCTIPNGYPLSPHNGAPSSIDFPTTLSLTIKRQDRAYHLKSSNFSASLIGIPFFPGFEDDPFLHEPRTGSPRSIGRIYGTEKVGLSHYLHNFVRSSQHNKMKKARPFFGEFYYEQREISEWGSTIMKEMKRLSSEREFDLRVVTSGLIASVAIAENLNVNLQIRDRFYHPFFGIGRCETFITQAQLFPVGAFLQAVNLCIIIAYATANKLTGLYHKLAFQQSNKNGGELLEMTDEEIEAILNEAIQESKTEEKTSNKKKKKDKTSPDQTEATKELGDAKTSFVLESQKKEKEEEIKKEKEEGKEEEKAPTTDMGKETEKKTISSEVSYLEAASLYPALYDGTIPDEKADSFDDYQEVVGKRRRRNKKATNSPPVISLKDQQKKKTSENLPNQRPSRKLAESPAQQRAFGITSDKHVAITKSPTSIKPTQQPSLGSAVVSIAGPSSSVKPSQPSSGGNVMPTVRLPKSAWSKPLVYSFTPSPPTQTKSKSVSPQKCASKTPAQNGQEKRQPVPIGSGSSKPTTAQVSNLSFKQPSATTDPSEQAQVSKTWNPKGRHSGKRPPIRSTQTAIQGSNRRKQSEFALTPPPDSGSLKFETFDIYPSKWKLSSQVPPTPQQQSTTSKLAHKTPEHHVPVGMKPPKSSCLTQQPSFSKPIHQAQKMSTQQTHGGPSKSSETEARKSWTIVQEQPSTSKTVQLSSASSKTSQKKKVTVLETPKPSIPVQQKSTTHQAPGSPNITQQQQQTPSRPPTLLSTPTSSFHGPNYVSPEGKLPNSVALLPGGTPVENRTDIHEEPPRHFTAEDFDPSIEPYPLPPECVPHGRIGDYKLEMMSTPQDLPLQGEFAEHLRALDQFLTEEWKAFEKIMARPKRQKEK
ncbi:hypothetical protein ACTXT7_016682, partial [Hymenolepis weldensis]